MPPMLSLLTTSSWLGNWLREGRPAPIGEGLVPKSTPVLRGDDVSAPAEHAAVHHAPWYATLWLTGVDYFSSLGYAPGLAIMAAGYVAPVATLILIGVTFFAALPVYSMVAKHSSDGEGSIKMIERLTARWGRLGWFGKTIVLGLLGFAMTDFVITITLSAADATHHIVQNPAFSEYVPHRPVLVTAALIGALCIVFLKGFKEAIGLSVAIALPYMVLNGVVIAAGFMQLQDHPEQLQQWWSKVLAFDVAQLRESLVKMSTEGAGPTSHLSGGGTLMLIAVSLLVFPKLALGMSGFETGVSVMPHISAPDQAARVRNTRKLLTGAALLMCVELFGANLIAAVLIPEKEFWVESAGQPAGKAAGRALAYLAHELLGSSFGTIYDVITCLILWFAGASAMAGLLNILPRYLPRFGMSPAWLEFRRPLVLVVTSVCLTVNYAFDADVEAQGGAYATGVLVLMMSGAFAVLLAEWDKRMRRYAFSLILGVFAYVTIVNAAERPDGLKIATMFILAIIAASVFSRWRRASELRVCGIRFVDEESEKLWQELGNRNDVAIVPLRSNTPQARMRTEARNLQHHHATESQFAFLHVNLLEDPSQFDSPVRIRVYREHDHMIIEVHDAVAVANAIAFVALSLKAREVVIGLLDSGTPVVNSLMYLLFGTGEVGYAVRAIFMRIREESLNLQYEARRTFDKQRDALEKELLRDALLLDEAHRQERTHEMFALEQAKFEAQVASTPHLPRLILFD
ncbi:MAG: hypothetical protein HY902_10055 [Deltaproteobacteria bacterium]|nr:hypothetical protein [Deltaproteobacteria bacterium]